MFDLAIGFLEVAALISIMVACYLALDLVRELREMREDAREDDEAKRYYKGDWP